MKKHTLALIFIFVIGFNVNAQIEIMEDNKDYSAIIDVPYDSLHNMKHMRHGTVDDYAYTYHHLIGQTIMFCGDPYDSFSTNKQEKYVLGNYYRIERILPNDTGRGLYDRLVLTDLKTGKTIEEGDLHTDNYNYKWVVLGHYEKIKSLYTGKIFVCIGESEFKQIGLRNVETDTLTYNIKRESVWTCVEVKVKPRKKNDGMMFDNRSPIVLIFDNEEYGKHYCYLEDKNGSACINYSSDKKPLLCGKFELKSSFDKKKAETVAKLKKRKADLTKKFGKTNANLICDGRISIGMTKEMCIEAWGEPYDINITTTSYGSIEQWVYGNSYVYFKGNRITAIQN